MSAWTERIRQTWDLSPIEEDMLAAADQARERWLALSKQLDEEGYMIAGRYEGVSRLNPLVGAEARARESFLRALKALGLKDEDDG